MMCVQQVGMNLLAGRQITGFMEAEYFRQVVPFSWETRLQVLYAVGV